MNKACLICGKLTNNSNKEYHDTCYYNLFRSHNFQLDTLLKENFDSVASSHLLEGDAISGVQKKITFSPVSLKKASRITYLDIKNGFILKAGDHSKKYIAEYENLAMNLAEIASIKTVPHGLIKQNGSTYYVSRRIDRDIIDGKIIKYPMEDFCQLSNTLTENKYRGSYEKVAREVIQKYSSIPQLDLVIFYKILIFSYIIGNTDMHLKNFSLINKGNGYRLSDAYDLLPVELIVNQDETALTLNGKRKNFTYNDFLIFAEKIGINKVTGYKIIFSIIDKKSEFEVMIKNSSLPENEQNNFINLINERCLRLRKA